MWLLLVAVFLFLASVGRIHVGAIGGKQEELQFSGPQSSLFIGF